MNQISEFDCCSKAGVHYACSAAQFMDPATLLPSIAIVVSKEGMRIGSVQFVFSAQFQATFKGYWRNLIFVAQRRFENEAWIEQVLRHPGEDLQNPFEDIP